MGLKKLLVILSFEYWHRLILTSLEDWSIWRNLASDQAIAIIAKRHGRTREEFVAELEQYSFEFLERFGVAPQSATLNTIKNEDWQRRLSCGTLPLSLDERWEICKEYSHKDNSDYAITD